MPMATLNVFPLSKYAMLCSSCSNFL